MRVHELAKEYNIKSTDFVDIIQEFGIDIKSHLSTLDDAQVADIKFKMDMKDHTKESELNPLDNLTQKEVDKLKPTAYENKEVLRIETEETVEERNKRRHQEIIEENERVITKEKELEAQRIADKASAFKQEQFERSAKSGFWGWLKSIFS